MNIRGLVTFVALAAGANAAQAATLDYDFSIDAVEGGTAPDEVRLTFLEVLKTVEIASLAAQLRVLEARDIVATWTIYASNANDDILSTVTSVDANFSFAGDDKEIIETPLSVVLEAGYYLFALQTDEPLFYTNYLEPNLGDELPYFTEDGAFRVINGGILQPTDSVDPTEISGNVRLPAIQVGYEIVPTVPLPAGGVLLLSGLGALALRRQPRVASV